MMTIKATTNNIGAAIHGAFMPQGQEYIALKEGRSARKITNIDTVDESNLKISLDNGQTFVVRIFAGE